MKVNCYADSQDVCSVVNNLKKTTTPHQSSPKGCLPPQKRHYSADFWATCHAFFHQAPLLWNNLFYSIQRSSSAASLKSALKNQLFPSEHQTDCCIWFTCMCVWLCVSMYMHVCALCVCVCVCVCVLEVMRQTRDETFWGYAHVIKPVFTVLFKICPVLSTLLFLY